MVRQNILFRYKPNQTPVFVVDLRESMETHMLFAHIVTSRLNQPALRQHAIEPVAATLKREF